MSTPPPVTPEQLAIIKRETARLQLLADLHLANPRPDLERAVALAEYSQTDRPEGESDFAYLAYHNAGGPAMSAWRGFQAGLRAQVEWLKR